MPLTTTTLSLLRKTPLATSDTAFQFRDHSHSNSTYFMLLTSATPAKWNLWGTLHQAKRLTTNWEQGLQSIKKKFLHAGYPQNFIQKTINEFEKSKEPDTIFPVNWFDNRRTVTICVPYCEANEQQRVFIRVRYKFPIIRQKKKLV